MIFKEVLQYLIIDNLKGKIEDTKDDDIFKNSGIISLNETHLGHSDTLTTDMIGISKDVLIVHMTAITEEVVLPSL